MPSINIRLTEEQHEFLRRRSFQERRSINFIVRGLVRRAMFDLVAGAYWRARGLGGTNDDGRRAAREIAEAYGMRIVDGHPVPYSLTVYLGDDSLGYVGEAIEGGKKYYDTEDEID